MASRAAQSVSGGGALRASSAQLVSHWAACLFFMIGRYRHGPMSAHPCAKEGTELVDVYMDQLVRWVGEGRLTVAKVTEFDASAVPRAHQLIQSGKSVGKIVCRTKEQQG